MVVLIRNAVMQISTNVREITAGVPHTLRVRTHLVVTSVSVRLDTKLVAHSALVSCRLDTV